MTFELLVQLAVEIVRAVLMDEASERVRKKMHRLSSKIHPPGTKSPATIIRQRTRSRLMNKLHTPGE